MDTGSIINSKLRHKIMERLGNLVPLLDVESTISIDVKFYGRIRRLVAVPVLGNLNRGVL